MDEKSIKDNIRMFRLRRGLSQEEVAEALHISRVSYSNLEGGNVRIIHEKVRLLAKFFGVALEELLLGYSPDPDAAGLLQTTKEGYDVKFKTLQKEFDDRIEGKSAELAALRSLAASQQKTIETQEEIIQMLKSRIPKENA